jgi:hypothetical protein
MLLGALHEVLVCLLCRHSILNRVPPSSNLVLTVNELCHLLWSNPYSTLVAELYRVWLGRRG